MYKSSILGNCFKDSHKCCIPPKHIPHIIQYTYNTTSEKSSNIPPPPKPPTHLPKTSPKPSIRVATLILLAPIHSVLNPLSMNPGHRTGRMGGRDGDGPIPPAVVQLVPHRLCLRSVSPAGGGEMGGGAEMGKGDRNNTNKLLSCMRATGQTWNTKLCGTTQTGR